MQGFQYKHGDRPLDGYTIQRAAGRGGFGEVYYALSDSGREVALKLIQGYEDIELRGITQCMNLKSPHLVTIFDVKRSAEGKCFVIMEFVAGPSLREIIDESPAGLGSQKAAYFLREIGKGLSYLHDCGIVHRDLKPGNIFYENGYVKIGDYGLSKAIAPSQHSGQTITVGTVHYMAPEIGVGVYDARIDIYALGALLYEMLTGQPPFLGASIGEILMKHISAEPDVSGIEAPFAAVIRKAMAKNPQDRYQSVQEMVEAVFGADQIRNSVSCFSPDSLTMVAGRVAKNIPAANSADKKEYERKPDIEDDVWLKFGKRMDEVGKRMEEASKQFSRRSGHTNTLMDEFGDPLTEGDPKNDPMNPRQRRMLILTTAGLVSLAGGLFLGESNFFETVVMFFVMILAATKIIWQVRWRMWPDAGKNDKDRVLPVIVMSVLVIAVTLFLSFLFRDAYRLWFIKSGDARGSGLGLGIGLGISIGIFNWWSLTAVNRPKRVSLKHVLAASLPACFACLLFHGPVEFALVIMAGTMLVAQIGCPFDPTVKRKFKTKQNPAQAGSVAEPHCSSYDADNSFNSPKPVAAWVRIIFLILFVLTLSAGLMCLISLGIVNFQNDNDAFVVTLAFGINLPILALFCMIKSIQKSYRHWWSSFVKPILLILCIQTIITASIVLGFTDMKKHYDIAMAAIFFIIFFSILFFVIAFIPAKIFASVKIPRLIPQAAPSPVTLQSISPFTQSWALILASGIFTGFGGLQPFLCRKIWLRPALALHRRTLRRRPAHRRRHDPHRPVHRQRRPTTLQVGMANGTHNHLSAHLGEQNLSAFTTGSTTIQLHRPAAANQSVPDGDGLFTRRPRLRHRSPARAPFA